MNDPTNAFPASGDVIAMGDVEVEGETTCRCLVIQFPTEDAVREAIKAGRCEFTVFGRPQPAAAPEGGRP